MPAIVGIGVVASRDATLAATNGDDTLKTVAYIGTRDVRHKVDVAAQGSQDADYHGVFDVQASRTTKRSGTNLIEIEARFFAVRSGGYRFDAAMREVIVLDEHISGSNDEVVLDESELDRATFGYLAPALCQGICVPTAARGALIVGNGSETVTGGACVSAS